MALASSPAVGTAPASVWDADSGSKLFSLTGHTGEISTAAFSPDGTRILTASWGGAIVWDADSGSRLLSLAGHTGDDLHRSLQP
jgi:WD40 repeat protein